VLRAAVGAEEELVAERELGLADFQAQLLGAAPSQP
jgi:hypothetical protein